MLNIDTTEPEVKVTAAPSKHKRLRFSRQIWLILGLFALVVGTFVAYVIAEEQTDQANDVRQQSLQLAEELRRSSDDLTRMVRTYVVTGKPIYKAHYQEILDIRDGRKPRPVNYHGIYWDVVMSDNQRPGPFGEAIPLLTMMKRANITDQELAKLGEAKRNSDELTATELAAMALVEQAGPSVQLNRAKAVEMLYDAAYHDAKARIMRPIGDFYTMVHQRTTAAVSAAEGKAFQVRLALISFAVILVLAVLNLRRQQNKILGGSLEDVYTGIADIGAGNVSAPIVVATGAQDSVLGWVSETQLKLAQTDAERRQAEEALRLSRDQLNEAQRIATVGSWSLDLRTNRREWSDEIFRIFEIDPARFEASYEAFHSVIHSDDRNTVDRVYMDSRASGMPYEITYRLQFPDGRIKFVRECGETQYEDGPNSPPVSSQGIVQDVTADKLTEETLRLYANIFQRSGEAIVVTDQNNCIIAVNPAFTQLTGYVLDDVRGRNPRVLSAEQASPETYKDMWAALNETGFWQGELWDRRKDGTAYPKWVAISLIRDDDQRVTHHIASFTDISIRHALEEQLHQLAHHDALTGLPNRFSLKERIDQALLSAQREKRQLAVMFLDMDRFKVVNDTLGHHVGDALLIEVARRLRACVRESDIVARIGGDEFVVALTGVESATVGAISVSDKILRSLGEAYVIDDNKIHSSPSIGVAIYPDDGADIEALMKNADTAMYCAKQQGRNNCKFFSADMNEDA